MPYAFLNYFFWGGLVRVTAVLYICIYICRCESCVLYVMLHGVVDVRVYERECAEQIIFGGID